MTYMQIDCDSVKLLPFIANQTKLMTILLIISYLIMHNHFSA